MTENRPHFCYVLRNAQGRSYIGYSVNLERRLRQHNGELVGGARATAGKGPWVFWVTVEGREADGFTKHVALSMEWWLKHPDGKWRGRGNRTPAYMQETVAKVLGMEKFTGLGLVVKWWWGENRTVPEESQSAQGPNNMNGVVGQVAADVIGDGDIQEGSPEA